MKMTVIAGVRYNNGLVIGSDRLVVANNSSRFNEKKIFAHDNMLVAITGTFFGRGYVKNNWDLFSMFSNNICMCDTYEEAVDDFKFFFDEINKSGFLRVLNEIYKSKGEGVDSSLLDINLSFLLGFEYKNSFSLNYYKSDDRSMNKSKEGCYSIPFSGFFNFDWPLKLSRDDAIDYVKDIIESQESVRPMYCSGLEIYDMNKRGLKKVCYRGPLL